VSAGFNPAFLRYNAARMLESGEKSMRVPQWFVMVWVVGISALALGLSVVSYTFVRDFAADSAFKLPAPPQLGRPAAEAENDPASATPTPAPVAAEPLAPEEQPSVDQPPADVTAEPEATAEASVPSVAEGGVPPVRDDPRRVTILLMGIDQRAGETGTFPTDTIILFSLDPVGNTSAILSIPRDLWVTYPAPYNAGRINGANIIGDELNYPGGGGPKLAMKTVERELGVPINHYVLINFEVFTTLIDAVGPIEVCPTETIHDDKYPDGSYGYITVHFDPGCQELDSERLLQYARTRHSDSDIGRSSRQQEVILSVRRKVLSAGGVMALLPQVPALWASMQANIRTDLSIEDMISLARQAEHVPSENIRQGQISFGEVYASTSPDGDEILVPIKSDILLLIEDLFRPPGTPSSRE
jgi:LCP family protein required for cell wall assembly